MKVLDQILVTLGLLLCGIWQRVFSPFVGARCRYYPSCSQYTAEALREFGFIRGAAKGIIRILRCNSLFPGGYEPVKKPVKKCDSAEIGV